MNPYYVTQERLEELKKELEEYKTAKRFEVADALRQAKELGDLSENSEYTQARDEQNKVEMRIAELEDLIKNAVIIKKGAPSDIVTIGSVVTATRGKTQVRYEIVGSNEANPEQGKISNESPLGKAFLERKIGETITVNSPAGTTEYKITKVE